MKKSEQPIPPGEFEQESQQTDSGLACDFGVGHQGGDQLNTPVNGEENGNISQETTCATEEDPYDLDKFLDGFTEKLLNEDDAAKAVLQVTHDAFFYYLFKMPALAIAFFRLILPKKLLNSLIIEQLEVSSRVYLTSNLRKKYPDLIYTIPIRKTPKGEGNGDSSEDEIGGYLHITIILEHKSFNDRHVIIQILGYSLEEIRESIKNASGSDYVSKDLLIPPILLIIFIHGDEKYTGKHELKEFFYHVEGMEDYLINVKPIIFDLHEISYDDLPKDPDVPELEVGLALLKAAYDPEVGMQAHKALEKLKPYIHEEAYQKFVQVALSYLASNSTYLDRNEVKSLSNMFYPIIERRFTMPGLIQRTREEGIQEGRKEGREEGREEGRQEERVTTILEYLQERFGDVSDEIIQRLEAIQDLDQLKSLFKTALRCSSLWEFEQNM